MEQCSNCSRPATEVVEAQEDYGHSHYVSLCAQCAEKQITQSHDATEYERAWHYYPTDFPVWAEESGLLTLCRHCVESDAELLALCKRGPAAMQARVDSHKRRLDMNVQTGVGKRGTVTHVGGRWFHPIRLATFAPRLQAELPEATILVVAGHIEVTGVLTAQVSRAVRKLGPM